MSKKFIFIALLVAIFAIFVSVYGYKESRIAYCNSIANLPAVPDSTGIGGLVDVDMLKSCKSVMTPEDFAGLTANLVERNTGLSTTVISDYPYVVVYNGEVISPERINNTLSVPMAPSTQLVFYMQGIDTPITEIRVLECGEGASMSATGILQISTCPN